MDLSPLGQTFQVVKFNSTVENSILNLVKMWKMEFADFVLRAEKAHYIAT